MKTILSLLLLLFILVPSSNTIFAQSEANKKVLFYLKTDAKLQDRTAVDADSDQNTNRGKAVEEDDDDAVFVQVERMPEFPGGQEGMFKYLSENIKYPSVAQKNSIQGKAMCQFIVNNDGYVSDVEVVRSSGDSSLDKEAIRLIEEMPRWTPGKQRGKPVRVKYTTPVNFRLQ